MSVDDGLSRETALRRYASGGWWALGVAALLLAIAAWMWLSHDPEAPVRLVCDGEEMAPGDTCVVVAGGGNSYDYEEGVAEALATRRQVRSVVPFAAALLAAYAIAVLVVRQRRAAAGVDAPEARWHARPTEASPVLAALGLAATAFGGLLLAPHLAAGPSLEWLPGGVVLLLGALALFAAWPERPQLVCVDAEGLRAATGAEVVELPWRSVTAVEVLTEGDDPKWRVVAGETKVVLGPRLSQPAALGEALARAAAGERPV